MATTGEKAYVKKLLRDVPVFHWLRDVDEAHYMDFMDDLRQYIEAYGWPEKIVLYLSNLGGELGVGVAFYEYVRLSGLHVVTIAGGPIESAAVLLFLAGKERYASPSSSFLIHNPTLDVHGDLSSDNIEQTRDHILSTNKMCIQLLSRAIGLPKEDIEKISKDAFPFGVKRAKELGIVHHIV